MLSRSTKSGRFSWRTIAILCLSGSVLLLLIAHVTGVYQISFLQSFSPNNHPIRISDVTAQAGLELFKRPKINQNNPSYLEVMGGGVAVGDIDGDGWEDLFFTNMPSFEEVPEELSTSSALFRNLGDGTFKDITRESGLDQIKGYPIGALFFDYNNDGHQDLYVTAYNGGELFRNEAGVFTNVTHSANVNLEGYCGDFPCMVAAASSADYDRDGFLDLLLINNVDWDINDSRYYGRGSLIPIHYNAQPTILLRNNGDGTFQNVSAESGVNNQDAHRHREDGKGLSAVWTDFNNDRWPDIYIANDLSPNRLYINKKDGTFSEVGIAAFVDEAKSSMGVDAVDFNHSGEVDLVTTNLIGQMASLFKNYGNLRFDYVTYQTGIMPSARVSGWGVVFIDLDLDGHQDLVMGNGPLWQPEDELEAKNLFFKNRGNESFQNVTDEIVQFPNHAMTRGLAVTDFDRSGTPDLIFSNINGDTSQLIKNQSTGNNWVRLDFEGTLSNRDAIGVRAIVKRRDRQVQMQTVKAGNSYVSSGSKSLFFGLGESSIDTLVIQWPSGRDDTLTNLEMNRIHHFREGAVKPTKDE
ncbi:CRTAC1 family protein [Rhodohalobacter sp. 614A]|uniref:CRTAC1 family protein n=1 Tax=Rhodohalobacter sp. 614A TaxID=2908649 RepID=UPI001F36B197|nr:CRTAC1 family protein [Rhodohalobacter sp. 614A]